MSGRVAFGPAIRRARTRAANNPFTWGRDDCLIWLADIYVAVLGRDPAADWRGRYDSERTARKAMGRGGVPTAVRKAAKAMGWTKIKPEAAQAGDLGLVRTDAGPAGVIFDGTLWIGRIEHGFSGWRTACVTHAWRVS